MPYRHKIFLKGIDAFIWDEVCWVFIFNWNISSHTSHLTPHTSHLTPHTSHLTPHTSHLTSGQYGSQMGRRCCWPAPPRHPPKFCSIWRGPYFVRWRFSAVVTCPQICCRPVSILCQNVYVVQFCHNFFVDTKHSGSRSLMGSICVINWEWDKSCYFPPQVLLCKCSWINRCSLAERFQWR